MLESLKGTEASKQAEDSLAYMARLDWPREEKSYPRLYGKAGLTLKRPSPNLACMAKLNWSGKGKA